MGAHSRLAARPAGGHLQRAHDGIRTRDLFLTKEVLYRLSYASARTVSGADPARGERRESNPRPPEPQSGALTD